MSDMTKWPDETQTAFAIRCIKAEAWAEGYQQAGSEAPFLYGHPTPNPYATRRETETDPTPEET